MKNKDLQELLKKYPDDIDFVIWDSQGEEWDFSQIGPYRETFTVDDYYCDYKGIPYPIGYTYDKMVFDLNV